MNKNIKKDVKNYEKFRLIGKGSTSQVFLVKEVSTKKFFAAKIYNYELDNLSKKDSVILKREINSIFKLNFPSIIKFKDFSLTDFNQERHPVLITEYIPNGNLTSVIQKSKEGQYPANWTDTKKLINIFGIASAMSYLHKRSIIHKDLNPNNILETRLFHPKICDFGLSKLNQSNTQQPQIDIKGTRFYTAPEILSQSEYQNSCDVYSFAMTVYSILTNEEPFENESKNTPYYKLVLQIVQEKRPAKKSDIPERYWQLITKCWAPEPRSRPSFEEIVKELRDDDKFITEKVDKNEYFRYIRYIDSLGQEEAYEEEEYEPEIEEEVKESPFAIDVPSVSLSSFEQKEKVGVGSFGKVYKVIDKETGNIYAAKILINEFYERFKVTKSGIYLSREVTILSHSNFPSIMKFIGYSATDFNDTFRPVIVTEFLPNKSLEKLLELERSGFNVPGWNDTNRLINIYGIAAALSYLHSNNIIHRDLKPDNVLLDEYLLPKLSDFGYSKSLLQEENIQYKEIYSNPVGTPSFVAPEIYMEGEFTKAVDVYAFAMYAYEIMTKTFPFEGLNEFQIQYIVGIEEKRPEFKNEIPKAYRDLIEECWIGDTSKRITIDQVIHKLKTEKGFITENVDESLYLSYIKYIDERDDNQIEKFPPHFLQSTFSEYEKAVEFPEGPGFMNPNELEIMKKSKASRSDLFTYQNFELKNKSYSGKISNFIINFTTEEKVQIAKDVSKLSQMKHPAIQQFISFSYSNFKNERKPTTLYEKTTGQFLLDIIDEEQKGNKIENLDSTNKLIIIYGIASAMSFLHKNGIKNPSLNPQNIIIDENMHPKLCEIGFHSQLQYSKMSSTRSEFVNRVTNFYLSPEFLASKNISEKSDVYSFALTLYSIVTNRIPAHNINKAQCYTPEFDESVPDVYKEMISICASQDQNERLSFEAIVWKLENDRRFITEDVNEEEYRKYIESVKSRTVYPKESETK